MRGTNLSQRLRRRLIRTGQVPGPRGWLGRWYGRRFGWRLDFGPRIIIDQPSEFMQAQMLLQGAYEPGVISVLMAALDHGDLLIDIGGNMGQYALIAAYRGVLVHTFEPVPRLAQRLRQNVAMNGLGRLVSVETAALSDRRATAELFVNGREDDGSHSLLPGITARSTEIIRVPTLTLDEYLAAMGLHPTAIKIDVEGAEALVLDGATKTLDRNDRPVVVLETGDRLSDQLGESASSVLDRLFRRQYSIFRIAEASGKLCQVRPSEIVGDLANYIAVPDSSILLKRILRAGEGTIPGSKQ